MRAYAYKIFKKYLVLNIFLLYFRYIFLLNIDGSRIYLYCISSYIYLIKQKWFKIYFYYILNAIRSLRNKQPKNIFILYFRYTILLAIYSSRIYFIIYIPSLRIYKAYYSFGIIKPPKYKQVYISLRHKSFYSLVTMKTLIYKWQCAYLLDISRSIFFTSLSLLSYWLVSHSFSLYICMYILKKQDFL